MKDKKINIRITNKGAIIGISMICTALITILSYKGKTLNEVKDDLVLQLKKQISWLDRENDKTISKEEMELAKQEAKQTIKMVEKLWNR